MAKVIDERVTEMRFDNSNFEANVKTSINSINKLKDSLNFSGSTKTMQQLDSATTSMANNFGGAINSVINRFSALQVMGITALANITNSAVNAGKRITSALTIDPIKTGFQEYETQINAVQTILANTESKGSTLKDVNKALDELNKYADMTIYNFTEMTRNIGTFTAAGVDLETSVSAIKGIANLAAVSGSNAQQASTAMYQLSQALAAGTVKLQDWNSVVNAGMGGQVFQDALKETARVHGIKIDEMIKKEGSFRETLQKGWLTSQILTETLAKFTGDLNEKQLKSIGYTDEQIKAIMKMGKTANDAATKVKTFTQLFDTLKEAAQSGWTQTWEILVGDFEEAKVLLTSISDTVSGFINKMSDSRNNLLSGWKDLGGRTKLIEGITNIFKYLLDILKPIGEAFREIFPPTTSKELYDMTEGFTSFTEKLVVSEEQAGRIKSTFSGLFAVIKGIINVIKVVSKAISPMFVGMAKGIDLLLSITAIIGDFITAMGDAINKSKVFSGVFEAVRDVIDSIIYIISGGMDRIKEVFNSINFFSSEGLQNASEEVQNALEPFTKIGTAFMNTFKGLTKIIKKAADYLVQGFSFMGQKINEVLSGEGMKNLFDFTNGTLITAILFGVKKLIDKISEFNIGDVGFLDSINGTLGAVKDTLKAYQSQLKAGTLMQIATSMMVLAGSLFMLSLIEPSRLTGALGAMAGLMGEMMATMFIIDKMAMKGGFKGITRVSIAMIGILIAVNIMSTALTKLSKIPTTSILKGLFAMMNIMVMMSLTAKSFGKVEGGMIKTSIAMIILGNALKVMADAIDKLGKIDLAVMGKGLLGMASVLGVLSIFTRSITTTKGLISLSIALIILGDAMIKFGDSLKTIGEIKMETLAKGLLGFVSVLGIVSMAMKSIPKGITMQSISLVVIASSLKIFSESLQSIGSIQWENLGRGLLGMVSVLGIVSMAMKSIPKGNIVNGAGLAVIGGSLLILSEALKSMGGMNLETIAKGLLTMVGALGVISMAMRSLTGALPGAASLLVVATALRILAPALETFGKLSLSEIGKSLLLLASAFTVIGVAGLLLTPILPSLLLLGGAITLIGIGCGAAGAGLLAFSAGLTALVGVGSAGVTILFELFKKVMDLIPVFFEKIAQGIEAFIVNLASSIETIVAALVKIGGAIINGLTILIPQVVNAVLLLVASIISSLMEHVPEMVDSGMKLIAGFLQGIANNIGDVIQAGADVVINFINGLATKIPEIVDAALNLTVKFIDGLATGVDKHGPKLVSAVIRLFKSVIKTILSVIGGSFSAIWKKGEEISDWISGGIKAGASKAIDAIGGIVKSCLGKINDAWEDFKEAGANLVGGIKDGIKSKWNDIKTSVGDLGRSISSKFKSVMGIHSPSRVFAGFGKYLDLGLISGIRKYSGKVTSVASSMGDDVIDSMRKALESINYDIGDPNSPVITPVLDSSKLNKGIDMMNRLFKDTQTVNVGYSTFGKPALENVSSISQSMSIPRQNDVDIVDAIKDLKSSIKGIKGGDNYNLNGITYDDGSNIANAVGTLVRAAKIERRKD